MQERDVQAFGITMDYLMNNKNSEVVLQNSGLIEQTAEEAQQLLLENESLVLQITQNNLENRSQENILPMRQMNENLEKVILLLN